MNSFINIAIGIALIGWLLSRQIRIRPVRDSSSAKLFLVLGAIGLIETIDTIHTKGNGTVGTATILWIAGSLVVAAVFGVVRAMNVKVWKNKAGRIVSKGSVTTIVLWIVSLALHFAFELGIDHSSDVSGLGSVTILLYIALSLGVQREIVRFRAAGLAEEARPTV
jgi:predicted permease